MKLRLWTNLLAHQAHPARLLIERYATRWEHELFYRKLKSHLHGRANLNAQMPETAAQEALARLMAAAVIAHQRAAVPSAADVAMRKISFAKVLDATVALCRVMSLAAT